MKKMRIALLAVAIITAVTGSFAAKKKYDCYNQIQYYQSSPGVYQQAGVWGVNYICNGMLTTCTYILNPATGQYEACRTGNYFPVTLDEK